jgi:hypothetical protein
MLTNATLPANATSLVWIVTQLDKNVVQAILADETTALVGN